MKRVIKAEKMFGLIFRGLLFLSVVMAYTLSVWNLIDNYFREELKRYLNKDSELNKFAKPSYRKDIRSANSNYEKCYVDNLFVKYRNNNTCSIAKKTIQ